MAGKIIHHGGPHTMAAPTPWRPVHHGGPLTMAARKTAEKVFRSNIQGGGDSPPDDIQPLGNVIEAPPTSSGEGILHLAPTRLIPPNPAQSGSVNNPVPASRLSKTIRFQRSKLYKATPLGNAGTPLSCGDFHSPADSRRRRQPP
jgi:hypothetical protein